MCDADKVPSTNIQAPEKLPGPSSYFARASWLLLFGVSLGLGAWISVLARKRLLGIRASGSIDVMKPFVFLSTAVVIFAASGLWLCLPRADAQSTKPAPTATAQSTATQPSAAQQQDVQRYNELMRAQEEKAKRVDALLVRQEQLMDKQEAAFARFQKILDTWDQQQAQYQKYLDSLKK